MKSVFVGLLAVAHVAGDCYLHNPKGSNNRLNEKSANRNNGNRMFDSQNNNRGGYNVGDLDDTAFANAQGGQNAPAGNKFTQELNNGQYSLVYFSGSEIPIEWTAQHGCGGQEENDPHKLNCNMVIQYACNTDPAKQTVASLAMELKDGRNTNTPDTANNFNEITDQTRKTANDAAGRGRHESEAWYYECERRARNKGLFTADQKLKGQASKYTRQNPNGNRRGLECPEERDYFPYWKPSPFIDVAVLTDEPRDCGSDPNFPNSPDFSGNSQNKKDKCFCVGGTTDNARGKAYAALTEEACLEAKAESPELTWHCENHGVDPPVCRLGDWSRVNHLGNGDGIEPLTYDWTVPELNKLGNKVDISKGIAKCVLRVRYNISTDDYNPRTTDAAYNENKKTGVVSPVQQNPTVDVNAKLQGLKLAINTAQFGRTFQDRTHTFYVKPKPAGLAAGAKISNLNVRGKRGNIVQTFPSVEYDFVPNKVSVGTSDYVHIQWTGSNTHNNGNPAGDGQAGDAGEGTGGTDRQNMVCTTDDGRNYPIAMDQETHAAQCFLKQLDKCYVPKANNPAGYDTPSDGWVSLDNMDCAIYLASSGYYANMAAAAGGDLNVLLNNAPASLKSGVIVKFKAGTTGTFNYMNTRNNNFSNRSQKATITVA